ncbi:MAG: von Willebrand factor, partial [Herbinix sp.]|nr:von Willebrand factor [Herbinix sp.]
MQQSQGTDVQEKPEQKAAENTQDVLEDNSTSIFDMDGGMAITWDADRSISGSVEYGWEKPTKPTSEEYTEIDEAGFLNTTQNPLSTFSIDVDTASYANLRKNIN